MTIPGQHRAAHSADLVVVGLGYVGLPLAHAAAHAGLSVRGLDLSSTVVADLNSGRSHIDDISDADVQSMLERGFWATADGSSIAGASTVVICVPTPLTEQAAPDLTAVTAAARSIAEHLSLGTLVILESTTYPGTTDEVIRPILEATGLRIGSDIHLAFSPERIDPGNRDYGLHNTPKVVGGLTPDCTAAARRFYEHFVPQVIEAKSPREAEMAKLLENTYRHVNIALVNEMAMFCREINVDLWDAIRCAATKPFGFAPFYPGPGVGGHCIPIDPNYLSYKVRSLGMPFRFVELAQEINQRMPLYVARRAADLLNEQGMAVNGACILLIGVTYKPDIADQRETPVTAVAAELLRRGAHLSYHDPMVHSWSPAGREIARVADGYRAAAHADLTILLQPHKTIDIDRLTDNARLLFDTRGKADQRPHVAVL